MKKYLVKIIITLFTIIVNFNLISCKKNNLKYYEQFIKKINNKETFIMQISGYECPICQGFKIGAQKELYNNKNNIYFPNQKFKNYLDGKIAGQPNDLSIDGALAGSGIIWTDLEKNKIKNTKLITTYEEYKDSSDIFEEKWIKQLLNWIIKQERKINKLSENLIDYTITVESLKLKQIPLFIFIKDGNYHGFHYQITDKVGEGAKIEEYIRIFISHIVIDDWYHDLYNI